MKLIVAAVGQRPPAWAEAACDDYVRRFPPELRLELKAVKAEPRTTGKTAEAMMAAEAHRLDAACPRGARRVVLDERGTRFTTASLAERLRFWLGDGRDVAFVVGGPDGLDRALQRTADETMRLSDLKLPHALPP
jgi:23S rRNA (pseudouridine1915-N3)-methyltransferase